MPLHVRTATAFRWRLTAFDGQPLDLVRAHEEGEVRLAALANAYQCGFSTCHPPGSRLLLDLFVEEWASTSGPVQTRLRTAFDRARHRFAAQAPTQLDRDIDFATDLPTAVLLAVATEGTNVHAVWIGGDMAIHTRGFSAVGQTTPHTLREQVKREQPEHIGLLDSVPNVLLRTIGPGATDQDPPSSATFHVGAGDTIILLSKAIYRGPCVPVDDAAFAAATHASPSALAERLVELAFANDDAPYAAVGVLRFDGVDVAP